jgi:hypothetical protein
MPTGTIVTSARVNVAAHADWSVDPRKRWMAVARRDGAVWRLAAPVPAGDPATLLHRLRDPDGAVLFGIDCPIGLPRAYAEAHNIDAAFPVFLRDLARRPGFFHVCATLDEIGPDRPFYPMRGRAGMTRAAHAAALGLGSAQALHRAVDCATAERPAGAPPFWTLGANQSGKAALAAWRDILVPALNNGGRTRLWPFDGDLGGLLLFGMIVMAETYPAEALRHLGLRLAGSKRRQADRVMLAAGLQAVMMRLGAVPEPAMAGSVNDGFGADAAGEDRFDCTLGVLCVLNVLAGNRPAFVPDDPWVRRWEGWVLGQTALPRHRTQNLDTAPVSLPYGRQNRARTDV